MKRTLLISVLLLLAAAAAAQTIAEPVKNPVSSALRDILPGRQKNTVAAVEAMPADKFSFKPSADQMTFGHLVTHMVDSNNLLCSKAAAVPAPKVEAVKDTDSKTNSSPRSRPHSISAPTHSAKWTIRNLGRSRKDSAENK